MEHEKREAQLKSFYISLSYVGGGTVALFAMGIKALSQYDFISIIISIINLITLPVCFLGFGILYGDGMKSWFLVVVVQLIVFLIFWYLTYRYLLRNNMSKRK